MGREVKRVPVGFDWPLNKVWSGYLMPDTMDLPTCGDCAGDGYTPEARAIANTFYSFQTGDSRLSWSDKIGQAEVDNLLAEGRLKTWQGGRWQSLPLTAAQVNRSNRDGGALAAYGHDAINQHILVRFRCERLGIEVRCATCHGHGDIGTDEQRAAIDEWERTEPPTGEGWQVWETVSEGSPITPVFATREELVGHLVSVMGWRPDAAETFTSDGWAPSLVMAGGQVMKGAEDADRIAAALG